MHCCRCNTSDVWMDYCASCQLTLCDDCVREGCCGAEPMVSATFAPSPRMPQRYEDFVALGAKPLQALACVYGPRPLPRFRGGETWETLVRMNDAGMLRDDARA